MKRQKHFLTLILLLCVWPGASTAQAATADAVGAWGANDYGQTTVPVAAQSGVTAIAAGFSHTVALKNDGSVVAWGDNQYGQTTVPVAAQSGVTAIAAGGYHTVALKNDGSVVAWGSLDQSTVPAGLSGVTAIAAGGYHTVVILGTSVALRARASGNELVLSWLTSTAGLKLQSTFDLTPPVTWMDSTHPPAVLGAQFTVTNTLSSPVQYYRLRKP